MSNGTLALISALNYTNKKNDYVAVPSLTFGACANAIKAIGCKIIFIDSEKNSWNICINDLKNKFSKYKFKTLLNVHLNGFVSNIVEINKFCKKNKVSLIEDCAEALGAKINKVHVGNFGQIGTFSFFANKIISTGEGGMCVTNNKKIYNFLKKFKNHGMSPAKKYWHEIVGSNHRLSNIQAAIGLSQIENINKFLNARRKIYDQYNEFFKNKNYCKIINPINNSQISPWFYPFILDFRGTKHRDNLIKYLKRHKIESRNFFYPLHKMSIFKDFKFNNPNSIYYSKRGIFLPIYPSLKEQDVKRICYSINTYFKNF